jgi:hypothetical protein
MDNKGYFSAQNQKDRELQQLIEQQHANTMQAFSLAFDEKLTPEEFHVQNQKLIAQQEAHKRKIMMIIHKDWWQRGMYHACDSEFMDNEDYEQGLADLAKFMDMNPSEGSQEQREMLKLTELLQEYEERMGFGKEE